MDTDKLAIYLLAGVHLLVAIVCAFLLARDFMRKHWRGLTKRAFDGAKYCPECGQGVVGFLGKCEMCGYNPPRK